MFRSLSELIIEGRDRWWTHPAISHRHSMGKFHNTVRNIPKFPDRSFVLYNRIILFTNFNAQFIIHKQYVCYTTILDMFRALTCPSSGGQIVFSQHLVLSLSVNGCTVHRLRADCSPLLNCVLYSRLQSATIPDAVRIQFVLLKTGMLMLETCRG